MLELPNVHDASLIVFSSMQETKNIVFGVRMPGSDEIKTIIFSDVLSYRLENYLIGCILLGPELVDPLDCFNSDVEYLEK